MYVSRGFALSTRPYHSYHLKYVLNYYLSLRSQLCRIYTKTSLQKWRHCVETLDVNSITKNRSTTRPLRPKYDISILLQVQLDFYKTIFIQLNSLSVIARSVCLVWHHCASPLSSPVSRQLYIGPSPLFLLPFQKSLLERKPSRFTDGTLRSRGKSPTWTLTR